jgi:hypothetical protein
MIVNESSNDSPAGGIVVVILAKKVAGSPGDFSIVIAGASSPAEDGFWR